MLHMSIHPTDLRNYDNKTIAKMYNVSERTVTRARDYHKVPYTIERIEFSESDYRRYSRKVLAEKLGTTEYYIRKYAAEKGWRKK